MRSILAVAALLAAFQCAAILIRTDRDDAEYLELATRYPSSVSLNAPDGEGVLIASRWVLTAAHRVKLMQELKTTPRLVFGGREYAIQSMFAHPEWKKGNPFDIGLILLREPVEGIVPTPIYREKDEAEETVMLIGHGYTGKIGEKAARENGDRKGRAAINTVDRVTPRTLSLRIKPPDEASDLQGAAAPSDSGGPLFLDTTSGMHVVGIGYATDDINNDGIIGNVGDWQLYVRVSAFAEWIDETMFKAAVEEASAIRKDR